MLLLQALGTVCTIETGGGEEVFMSLVESPTAVLADGIEVEDENGVGST